MSNNAVLLSFSVIQGTSRQRTLKQKSEVISIRCEQGTKEAGGLDIWLGRFAMIGFAVAITVEVSTGKGLLEVCETTII